MKFQYRKRYGLHAICSISQQCSLMKSFNTASGMDCMQSIMQGKYAAIILCFNTASGMDCMQFRFS